MHANRKHLNVLRVLAIALALNVAPSTYAQAAGLECSSIFPVLRQSQVMTVRSTKEAWNDSAQALSQIQNKVYGRASVIEALTTAILAKEFVWINGEPGGAKTFISRIMFESVLNSIPEREKKIFFIQFHKLIAEGKITGFQKFSSMMKDGKYDIETESSLVGEKFLYLIADEAEKSNPAVLNALLSVLNERKAFLGARVVDSILASGVFTSNKTTGEFIQSFHSDRPSGEALQDRMAIKLHIANQQSTVKETAAMYAMVKNPDRSKATLPLMDLEVLVSKIKITDEMMREIVALSREFDRLIVSKADESRGAYRRGEIDAEYFPANQFSTRSVRRMVQVFKASIIAKQLMDGVPYDQLRLTPERRDLSLLSRSALYAGPSSMKLKTFQVVDVKEGVQVKSPYGVTSEMAVRFSPYENYLLLQDGTGKTQFTFALVNGNWVVKSQSPDFAEWTVDPKGLKALDPKLKAVIVDNKVDLEKPVYEVDDATEKLVGKGTVKKRTVLELTSIKDDLIKFAGILTQHFEKDKLPSLPASEKLLPQRTEREKREFRRDLRHADEQVRVQRYYDWMVYEVRALKQRFVELDHSIEAHMTGMLSENHLYVFGPPGGAKTALAEVILKSDLKSMNAKEVDLFVEKSLSAMSNDKAFLRSVLRHLRAQKPAHYDRFLLQFHKLLPEGVLTGFPKVEKQLNEGKEEIDVSTSLANEKFVYSILDEVDKANPQTIAALLSILNEREVFAGNTLIKTSLRTAILTSNKMPSEFLESYHEDRSTGEAVMDRAINKVFVSNKISSEETLTRFLVNLERGISPNWKGLLGVKELDVLVKQVEFENPALIEMLASIHQKFLALRIKKEESTHAEFKEDSRTKPDYYVSAAGSASDRTLIKLIDQLKARFIVNQMMNGVAYKDLRTEIQMKDLGLFFEGLGYWAPQKVEFYHTPEGMLQFNNKSEVMENLTTLGIVDERVKFHLLMMIEEAKDYTQVINAEMSAFMQEYKNEIAKYPDLFPSLFVGDRAKLK